MSDKLKYCPFCGWTATLRTDPFWNHFSIICNNCGVSTPEYSDKQDALMCWNTRVDDKHEN